MRFAPWPARQHFLPSCSRMPNTSLHMSRVTFGMHGSKSIMLHILCMQQGLPHLVYEVSMDEGVQAALEAWQVTVPQGSHSHHRLAEVGEHELCHGIVCAALQGASEAWGHELSRGIVCAALQRASEAWGHELSCKIVHAVLQVAAESMECQIPIGGPYPSHGL